MTLNEIIECIKEVKEDYWEDDGYGHETSDCQRITTALDEAIERLEQTRWIPANQPPKASGRYIVTMHFFDNDFVEMANYDTDLHTVDKYDFPKHKAGWYNDDSEYGHYELDDIVAWMPRPKPHTEGGVQHD